MALKLRLSTTVARQVRGNLAFANRRLRQAAGNLHAAEKAIDLAWANIQTERARPPTELARSADVARKLHVAADNLARRLIRWRKGQRL